HQPAARTERRVRRIPDPDRGLGAPGQGAPQLRTYGSLRYASVPGHSGQHHSLEPMGHRAPRNPGGRASQGHRPRQTGVRRPARL
ncbi:uncharacterized protein METZ01_LOCUS260584, partial [marine metagenome]